MDHCFWEALSLIRSEIEKPGPLVGMLSGKLLQARDRLEGRKRAPRSNAPDVTAVNSVARSRGKTMPEELVLPPGGITTLRAELGRALNFYNKASGGALLAASADLMGSTSSNTIGAGFPQGFFNASANPAARLLSLGGICEDAMVATLSGISAFGHNIGVGSSYGAFLAPLGHVAARLHAIGGQARRAITGEAVQPHDRRVRARRTEDRGGRANPCGPAAAPAPSGQLPAGDDDHPDAVGPPGNLVSPGSGAREAAGRHCAVRNAAQ